MQSNLQCKLGASGDRVIAELLTRASLHVRKRGLQNHQTQTARKRGWAAGWWHVGGMGQAAPYRCYLLQEKLMMPLKLSEVDLLRSSQRLNADDDGP